MVKLKAELAKGKDQDMLSTHLRERLKDAGYRELHLQAVSVLSKLEEPRWYDAQFLMFYEAAKRFIERVRPDRLSAFIEGFDVLRAPKNFGVQEIETVFDSSTHQRICETVAEINGRELDRREISDFGRLIFHDHPYFTELQHTLTTKISQLAGLDLEPGYNFLSLYGSSGKCEVHMDHPISMFTLDYCIDQNMDWPIYFSQVVDWPDLGINKALRPENIVNDPNLIFSELILKPRGALLFAGSNQWHYRNPIGSGGYCNLLFFHFFPKDAADLVYFEQWASLFELPELEPLCDIFAEKYPHLARKV